MNSILIKDTAREEREMIVNSKAMSEKSEEQLNNSIESVKACFKDIIKFMEKDVTVQFKEFSDMAKGYGEDVKNIRESMDSIAEVSAPPATGGAFWREEVIFIVMSIAVFYSF